MNRHFDYGIWSRWDSIYKVLTPKSLKDNAGLFSIITIYLLPIFFVLTTFPVFYDDESWLYLSPIEALRGNGFTWAAFGQGHSSNFTFDAIAYSLLSMSPFSLESTIRLISTGAGALLLVSAYLAARLLAPRAALIAPLLLVLSGQFYWVSRYGRSDSLSLLLLTASIWLSLAERPMLAGVGAGLSTSIYPLNGWVICFDGVIAGHKSGWKGLARCAVGTAIGVSWQVYGIAAHFTDVAAISRKFAVSASTRSASGVLAGILQSVGNEPTRYTAYVKSMFQQGDYASMTALVLLAACLLLAIKSTNWWITLLLVALPLTGIAVLVGLKNPYQFIFCLPPLAIASAIGAEYLPRPIFRALPVCAVGLIVLISWPAAIQRMGAPTPERVFSTVARTLPEGAIAFGPVLFAPVMEERPDVRFFTYHALSQGEGWNFPECAAIPPVIRDIVQTDRRRTSRAYIQNRSDLPIYFIWLDGYQSGYLRLIWPDLSDARADCLMPANRIQTKTISIEGKKPDHTERVGGGQLSLDKIP